MTCWTGGSPAAAVRSPCSAATRTRSPTPPAGPGSLPGTNHSQALRLAALAAWAAPPAAVAAISVARGKMAGIPRPAVIRPAAALAGLLTARALQPHRNQERGKGPRAAQGPESTGRRVGPAQGAEKACWLAQASRAAR